MDRDAVERQQRAERRRNVAARCTVFFLPISTACTMFLAATMCLLLLLKLNGADIPWSVVLSPTFIDLVLVLGHGILRFKYLVGLLESDAKRNQYVSMCSRISLSMGVAGTSGLLIPFLNHGTMALNVAFIPIYICGTLQCCITLGRKFPNQENAQTVAITNCCAGTLICLLILAPFLTVGVRATDGSSMPWRSAMWPVWTLLSILLLLSCLVLVLLLQPISEHWSNRFLRNLRLAIFGGVCTACCGFLLLIAGAIVTVAKLDDADVSYTDALVPFIAGFAVIALGLLCTGRYRMLYNSAHGTGLLVLQQRLEENRVPIAVANPVQPRTPEPSEPLKPKPERLIRESATLYKRIDDDAKAGTGDVETGDTPDGGGETPGAHPHTLRRASSTGDEKVCLVCMESAPNAVLLECGHSGVCDECAQRVIDTPKKECPLCRARIQQYVVVDLDSRREENGVSYVDVV